MIYRILDNLTEKLTRLYASKLSRRSFISILSTSLIAGYAFPFLPTNRQAHATGQDLSFSKNAQTSDPTACNYWRYCATDGYQCACCGGGPSTCPPGTTPSPTAWIGSCINPDDGETYLIAYRDCCGKDSCGKCACVGLEGEMPVYRPNLNNDIIWCYGSSSMVYHCSSAAIVGQV